MKIVGCILILLTTTLIGFRKADDFKNEYRQMCYMQRLLQILEGEIRYSHTHLQDIFEKMARQSVKPYKQWLYYLSENITDSDKSFECIWEDSIEGYLRESGLPRTERKLLAELGGQLGIFDRELQLEMLQLYKKEYELRIKDVQSNLKEKVNLSQYLGIAGGILTIILLM